MNIEPRVEPALVETGDNLGDMTSELKPGESKSEFGAAGPKNYAYKTVILRRADNTRRSVKSEE
jgi:hypothetical protein